MGLFSTLQLFRRKMKHHVCLLISWFIVSISAQGNGDGIPTDQIGNHATFDYSKLFFDDVTSYGIVDDKDEDVTYHGRNIFESHPDIDDFYRDDGASTAIESDPYDNEATGVASFVGGGVINGALGKSSFVGAGVENEASGESSFVGGGNVNYAKGSHAFVGSGTGGEAAGSSSFVGSGVLNSASGDLSFVGAGFNNVASGYASVAIGGIHNNAQHDNSFVFGGTMKQECTSTQANQFKVCSQDSLFSHNVVVDGTLSLGQYTDVAAELEAAVARADFALRCALVSLLFNFALWIVVMMLIKTLHYENNNDAGTETFEGYPVTVEQHSTEYSHATVSVQVNQKNIGHVTVV
jgi:hypothetical protein